MTGGGRDAARVLRGREEELFNASGWDILSAAQQGHRARTDVKGKLAEFFLNRQIEELLERKQIDSFVWSDKTGEPDFIVEVGGSTYRVECKNVRSGAKVFPDAYKVELQMTRNAIAGGPSRGYKFDEFEVLAACLFNQAGGWDYLFVPTHKLERRAGHPDYLVIMQKVPYGAQGVWKGTLAGSDQRPGGAKHAAVRNATRKGVFDRRPQIHAPGSRRQRQPDHDLAAVRPPFQARNTATPTRPITSRGSCPSPAR
jgi:hypothetical protein